MQPLIARFADYVQGTAGRTVAWGEPAVAALPAYLDKRYSGHWFDLDGQAWLAVMLKSREPEVPLVLAAHLEQLAERLGTTPERTCLVAEQLPAYLRRRLVELRQPFVIPGRQLFWPALGSAETVQRSRRLQPEPVPYLSPVAQQLLFALVLGRLPKATTVAGIAAALGYTGMSLSRAVKELEAGRLIATRMRGRTRRIELNDAPGTVWERARPLLRSPVLREICVREECLDTDLLTIAGETALAGASNLASPMTSVFAVASRKWGQVFVAANELPVLDIGCCQVQLWRYAPDPLARDGVADPLSLFLSLRDSKDMRVQIALDEMMGQIQW